MKKFIAVLLVLATVLAMTTVAFAYKEKALDLDTDTRMYFKKSAYGYEKVTNNYGKTKVVALKKGSVAKAVAQKGDWYKIEVPAKKAGKVDTYWFNKKYLRNRKDSDPYYYVVFSSGGSGRSHYQKEVKISTLNFTVKTSGKVNLRKHASLQGGSKGTIPKGKKAKLTGWYGWDDRGFDFVQVKYKGKTGYISCEYIREADQKKLWNKGGIGDYWDEIINSEENQDDGSDEEADSEEADVQE